MMEAATDQWPEVIAQIAERHHEGPLLAAAFEHHMVHVDDLYADVPWREYQRDALEQTPIRSVLSFELFQMKTGVSTLNRPPTLGGMSSAGMPVATARGRNAPCAGSVMNTT